VVKILTKETPNPIDIYVGSRLKQRRTALGISQEKLAEALEITFQQVQKYEKGINRMGASRLYQLSHILEVPITYFFDCYGGEDSYVLQEEQSSGYGKNASADFMKDLTTAINKVKNEETRQKILELIKTLTADHS
jgi:transcriptional regulator with XRE-family HTH domain